MDMQLNRKIIKDKRLERTWSQSHLAEVSDLSLRTIQRIEKHGQASMESAKALAAVLEMPVTALQTHQSKLPKFWPLPVVFALLSGFIFMLPAAAEKIMLNVLLSEQGEQLADVQMLNDQNKESEIKIGEDLKITFLSQVTETGLILTSVKIFERQGQALNLVAEPAIMTKHNQSAVIKLDDLSITLEANL